MLCRKWLQGLSNIMIINDKPDGAPVRALSNKELREK